MNAIEIKKGIYWVGAIDWKLRNFHGYTTHRGSTYNAYLILDDKITLIDTVKSDLKGEMLSRIKSVIDPSKIDLIVSNHVEPDHSGSILDVLSLAPGAKVLTVAPSGFKGLTAYYQNIPNLQTVKGGDIVELGKRSLRIIPTPMVHWPDNMYCYCPEEKLLFSNDSFGQHYSSNERFDDDARLDHVLDEAQKYYANIVQPYNAQVRKVLDAAAGLDIDMIAPAHGIIWRSHIPQIISLYKEWSSAVTRKKAVVVYQTMWGATEKMARAVETAFLNKGIPVKLFNLEIDHPSDVIAALFDAEYIAVGSPTLNNGMLPSVDGFLTFFRGLNGTRKKFLAFGSYGWGGQSIGDIDKKLEAMNLERLMPPLRFNFMPHDDDLLAMTAEIERYL